MIAKLARRFARTMVNKRGLSVISTDDLAVIRQQSRTGVKAQNLGMVKSANLRQALALLDKSESQLNQDLFALEVNQWKQGGFFVEFGAASGKHLSNTWLLEKEFGWRGILSEPGKVWRQPLERLGRNCAVDFDCVWSSTGEILTFCETEVAELSRLGDIEEKDDHARGERKTYSVKTISLQDLLDRHDAPAEIDYLSVDTEGSELAILEAFDFKSRKINCITVEHNYTADRDKIYNLLIRQGYTRMYENISRFDDWYAL